MDGGAGRRAARTRTGRRTWTGFSRCCWPTPWAGSRRWTTRPRPRRKTCSGRTPRSFVPLDVVMRYHARARRTSASLPHASRLAWLLQRDTEERADWVSRFRESTLTLGQVIKATYEAREARWVPAGNFSAPTKERQQASPAKPAARGSKPPLAKPIAGRAVARAMRDGTVLCQAFQHGQCKAGQSCPNGQHRCAAILRGDRVCGMQNRRRRSLEGGLGGRGTPPSARAWPLFAVDVLALDGTSLRSSAFMLRRSLLGAKEMVLGIAECSGNACRTEPVLLTRPTPTWASCKAREGGYSAVRVLRYTPCSFTPAML